MGFKEKRLGNYTAGEEILIKIEKCVQGGAGLARLPNGSVCFVPGTLPGELVEIKIVKQKKDFSEGAILRILEPNAKRRVPPCPYYGKCGGCNAQHAEFEYQIELLKKIVSELFARTAKINLPQNFEIHSGAEWGYRFRAQIFSTGDKWGFKARTSNTIIPIEKCMILCENLNGKTGHVFDNQTEKYLGKHIHADENVFFQNNLELLPKLINEIQKISVGTVLLDIFCGVGLFSAFLQNKFERIIAVEQNKQCQKFAKKNLGKNCKFYAMSAEEWFNKNTIPLNDATVLIDPPRTGMSNELCDILCKNKAGCLIYVSCDPATLARDTRKLLDSGYELKNIQGFAFYPQTFHLEMMAEFQSNTHHSRRLLAPAQ